MHFTPMGDIVLVMSLETGYHHTFLLLFVASFVLSGEWLEISRARVFGPF